MNQIDTEHAKVAREKFADYEQESRLRAGDAVKDYGSSTIRMAFLLNGGAILALLTLVGAMFGGDDTTKATAAVSFARALEWPFILYGVGVIAAAITARIGYFNYSSYEASHLDTPKLYFYLIGQVQPPSAWLGHFTKWSAWIAALFCFGSLVSFGVASWWVIAALGAIRL